VQITYTVTEAAPASTNEDAFRVGPGWALVLDGAGRYPGESGGCVHPVTWVVARLAEHIEHGLTAEPDTGLPAVVRAAISATVADHGPTCDLTDPLSPGAAAAVIRARGDDVEWLVIGDCAVVIEHHDGQHTAVIDDRVDNLPGAPITNSTVRTYSPDYVRTVRNRPGGFWVAGAVPEAADNAYVGQLPRTDVTRVLLCSDGISRLTERYGQSWGDVFALVDAHGPEALVGAVRRAEHDDPDPRRWRGKRHDDATAVLFRLAAPAPLSTVE
jgi:hypothetical protein